MRRPGSQSLVKMLPLLSLLSFLGCLQVAFAAFGVTTSGTNMVVDSGAGLVTTSKLGPIAPLTIVYNGMPLHYSPHYEWGYHFPTV